MTSPARSGDPFAALLQRARALAADVLAPHAEQSDQAGAPPVDNLRALGAAGLLGLTTPTRYGGQEAPRDVFRAYNETIAAACGVTSFIQLQHLSACMLVAGGENEGLKTARLPALAAGTVLCGVAFSHLRRGRRRCGRCPPTTAGCSTAWRPGSPAGGRWRKSYWAARCPTGGCSTSWRRWWAAPG